MSEAALFADDEKEMTEQIAAETEDATQETQEDTSEQEVEKTAEVSEEKPAEPEKASEEPAKQERVPLATLLDERRHRQQLEQDLQEQRENYARLDERLSHIQSATAKPETPSRDEDPVGYLENENRQLQERLKPLEDGQTAQREHAEHQAAIEDVSARTQAFEAQFTAENPDYHDAVNFMRSQAAGRYKVMGYDPMQVQELLQRDSLTLAHSALQNGKDPAAVAYEMAGLHGYKKAESKQDAAVDKIENIQKGQANASSLSGAGGEGAVQLTLEALADMDDDDFDKVSDAQWRKLVASG